MDAKKILTFSILAYKESPFLETCIKSIMEQSASCEVIIATTTPNSFITKLAKKYQLKIITGKHTNIGGDFDFAIHSAKTPLVTVAHQDDIYEKTYAEQVINAYKKHPNSSIIFTNYFEIRKGQKIYNNTLINIKHLLLIPINIKKSLKTKIAKRLILRFGDPICCPAVTFIVKNCPTKIFTSNFKCNCDWHAWEKLSKHSGAFTFVPEPLMGHRISENTTTTDMITRGIRTKEDYTIFKRFWPTPIAKILNKFYRYSEKSNNL